MMKSYEKSFYLRGESDVPNYEVSINIILKSSNRYPFHKLGFVPIPN